MYGDDDDDDDDDADNSNNEDDVQLWSLVIISSYNPLHN